MGDEPVEKGEDEDENEAAEDEEEDIGEDRADFTVVFSP